MRVLEQPPEAKNMSFIQEQIDSLNASATPQERKEITQNTGVVGDYSL